MMQLAVVMTETDVIRGTSDCNKCPTARAIRRTLKLAGAHFDDIEVYQGYVLIWAPGHHQGEKWEIDLPVRVRDFINRFDHWNGNRIAMGRELRPAPISFTLRRLPAGLLPR